MSYSVKIELAGLPPINSATRKHWRVQQRERKTWREAVMWSLKNKRPINGMLPHVVVEATRFSTAAQAPDDDNLRESFKPLIDGIVGLVVEDDSPQHVTVVPTWQRVAHRRDQRVTLRISDAPAGVCPACGRAR